MTTMIESPETQAASTPSLSITSDRAELASAVAWAAKGLPKRPVVPVLAGMRLEVCGGRIELAGFDYDMTCTARVAGSDAGDGAVLVNGAQLLAAVKSLPKAKGALVTLAADASSLTVTCNGIVSRLALLDAGEYPQVPEVPALAGIADAGILAGAVGRVALAAGRDDTLPSLTCVMLSTGDDLGLAATDRYRAHRESLAWLRDGDAPDVLIPAKPLAMAVKEMAKSGVISVHASEERREASGTWPAGWMSGFAALATESRTMIIRTCNPDQFPSKVMGNLWPKSTDDIAVDGPALAAAVKRAGAHVERNGSVTLECEPDRIMVVANPGGTREYREPVAAEGIPGCVLTARFNPAYLADALAVGGTKVTLGLTAPVRHEPLYASSKPSWSYGPVSVTPESGEFRAIVMRIANRGNTDEAVAEAAGYRTEIAVPVAA